VIRTILGDIEASAAGFCSAHDHVLIGDGIGTLRTPDLLIDDVDAAIDEIDEYRRSGGGTIVDAMPVDCGRDPVGLAEVSRRTGVHIVATTGFHKPEYYEAGHWSRSLSDDVIVDLLVSEIVDGMDRWSYGGPVVERLPARAGLVKVATDADGLTPLAKSRMAVAAAVHHRTGVPVLTHTEHGALAVEQVETLAAHGVSPDAVLVSHVDRNHDTGLHRALAATGCYVVYDGPSRSKYHEPEDVAGLIGAAVEAGGADRVLLGMDLALRPYRTSYGGSPGLGWLPGSFVPLLRRCGFSDEDVWRFGWGNPGRALSMRGHG
jgi:predicted metal-dependent phosphotriesterase family hydrolase